MKCKNIIGFINELELTAHFPISVPILGTHLQQTHSTKVMV